MEKLATLDYVVICLYLSILAGVGLFLGRFIKDIKDYFKGGNTIPWGIAGISNFMGSLSTFVFIAYAGVAYSDGLVGVTVLWCTVVPFVLAALVMGKRWVRSRISTPIEYLEIRFNNNIRQIFGWTGLGIRFLDNVVRQYAVGIFLTAATDVTFFEAILFSGAITVLFTLLGGVWAVVVIDTVQFIILVFISVLLVIFTLEATDGLGSLINNQPEHFKWFSGPKGQPLWLLVYYLIITIKYNGNWVFIQRFYSVKDEKATRKLGFLSAILLFIFPVIFLLPAIAAVEILPNLTDPEQAYVLVAVKLLPAGLLGLMIAAMFSATVSSLNSEYNVMSAVLTYDIYKRLINPYASDKLLIFVARFNVILVGLIVMIGSFFVEKLGGAFEANKILTGLFAIPLAIPLILGMLYKKTNPSGAFLAVFTGIFTGLFLIALSGLSWEVATLIQVICCVGVFYITGTVFPGNRSYRARVKVFFKKINTGLREREIENADPSFRFSLANLFSVAIAVSGILFLFIGLLSFPQNSGQMSIISGGTCILIAIFLKWYITGTFKFSKGGNDN